MGLLQHVRWVALLLCCTGCSFFIPKGDNFGARPVSYQQLPGWQDERHAEALNVFAVSCPLLSGKARPPSTGSGLEVPETVWKSLCDEAVSVAAYNHDGAAKAFFEQRFAPYRVTNNNREEGLFTGYYEPLLYGSLTRTGYFQYPLYKPPAALKNHNPYYTHAEINGGALNGNNLELVWVDDPVMRFFLHIQGSGRVMLEDGRELHVGYAGQNGHPYTSIGKVLHERNLMPKDQINFFTLRQWLYDHPRQAFEIMEQNPSYVFFTLRDTSGPVGAVGAVLTPLRSLAVDSRHIPYGLPLYLQTWLPEAPGRKSQPFHRLMIAQDTGGAIRGPVRGDIFFGHGQEAEYLAGHMKERGAYTLLVPREIEYQLR